MRFAEIALLAVPFIVFVVWRLLAPAAGPPKMLVIALSATVVAMAGLLLGFWYTEAEPPGTGYVPAQLQDGRIVREPLAPIVPNQAATVGSSPSTPAPVGTGRAAPGLASPAGRAQQ